MKGYTICTLSLKMYVGRVGIINGALGVTLTALVLLLLLEPNCIKCSVRLLAWKQGLESEQA